MLLIGATNGTKEQEMLVDEFLPVYDVSDTVATVVGADVATTWAALMDIDLFQVGRRRPLVAGLGAIRVLPETITRLLHGRVRGRVPSSLRLRDAATLPPSQGGWILLGLRDREEIALGLVGKFWLPVIEYEHVSRETFDSFNQPGYAKTIYSLSVQPLGARRTLLTAVMRTATTDDRARRWFRRYWTFGAGSGAHILVNGMLDATREMAEERQQRVLVDEEALCR